MRIVRAGAEAIDRLRPLWLALLEHHQAAGPAAAQGRRFRSPHDSWTLRRRRYEAWLVEPEASVFIAERGGRDVGYALVRVREGEAMLDTGDRVGELETLSVLPEERGAGVGAALIDAVRAHLRDLDVSLLSVAVIDNNPEAMRFYERYGMRPYFHALLGECG